MKATFWAVVKARRGYGNRVIGASLSHARHSKPSLKPDEIAVKITLDINERSFAEPIYAVEATVLADQTVPGPAIVIEQPEEES